MTPARWNLVVAFMLGLIVGGCGVGFSLNAFLKQTEIEPRQKYIDRLEKGVDARDTRIIELYDDNKYVQLKDPAHFRFGDGLSVYERMYPVEPKPSR